MSNVAPESVENLTVKEKFVMPAYMDSYKVE